MEQIKKNVNINIRFWAQKYAMKPRKLIIKNQILNKNQGKKSKKNVEIFSVLPGAMDVK